MPDDRSDIRTDPQRGTKMAQRRRLLVGLPALGLVVPALAGAAAAKGTPTDHAEAAGDTYAETEHVKAYYARARF